MRFVADDADATRRLGARFAEALRGGDLVLCAGDLGAGKTTFVQGVAAGLGITDPITSPTFVLAREHPLGGGGRFVHADAYRLDTLAELEDMIEDLVGDDAITCVEWGDVVAEALGRVGFVVRLTPVDNGETREIRIEATDPDRAHHLERELGVEA